jgi:hypothetical protein
MCALARALRAADVPAGAGTVEALLRRMPRTPLGLAGWMALPVEGQVERLAEMMRRGDV